MPDDVTRIPLSNSDLCATVDAVDAERVLAFRWRLDKDGYAVRTSRVHESLKHTTIYLHRFLLPGVWEIDHIDRDKLNCRRCNLRSASRSQNMANAPKRRNNTSGYKGVIWEPRATAWHAYIRVYYRQINLGNHKNIEDAARAYDAAARKHFGAFAHLNFPDDPVVE